MQFFKKKYLLCDLLYCHVFFSLENADINGFGKFAIILFYFFVLVSLLYFFCISFLRLTLSIFLFAFLCLHERFVSTFRVCFWIQKIEAPDACSNSIVTITRHLLSILRIVGMLVICNSFCSATMLSLK